MSTTPTPTPTIQQTQDELRAAAVSAQQPPAPPPASEPVAAPASPQPYEIAKQPDGSYEVKYSTGEIFKGTPDAIIAEVAKAHISTKEWAKQKAAQQPPAPAPPPPVAPAEDPAEVAARQFIAEGLARELGFSNAAEMKQHLSIMGNVTEKYQANDSILTFLASAPDFPNTPPASEAIGDALARMGIDVTRTVPTAEQFRQAHALCLYEKKYAPATPPPPAHVVPTPPPTLNASTPVTTAQAVDPWAKGTSLEQLRQAAIEAESKK